MNRKFSILGVVVLMVVTVVATVAVAFAKQDEEGGNGQTKVILCHNKEKNNRHTITVAEPAVDAHVAHGDSVGPCPSDAKTPEPPDGTTLTLTTRATNPAQPGDPISDEATLEGASPNATGDITFKLYGPFTSPDPSTDTCVDSGEGANLVTTLGPIPIRAPVNGANGANGAYVVSSGAYDPDPPLAVGRYQWVASYSGDPNDPQNEPVVANYTSGDDSNVSVSTKCNDPNEQSVVNGTTPPPDGTTLTLTTRATNPAQPGDPISDEATLEGASPNATGDITFKLYGPFTSPDPSTDTCVDSGEGANLVTTLGPIPIGNPDAQGNYVVSSGAYDPDPPLAVGRYQWVASYTSGDDSNVSVSTKCNDPNEQSVVTEGSTSATEEITNGTDQNDKIAGGAGRDRIRGFFGNDRVSGDQASDTLSGDDGADFVLGGFGRDRMSGGPGDDHMNGEDGKGGNDLIDGGEGTDHCVGDEGDTFRNCDGNIVEVTLPPDVSAPTEAGN